MPADRKNQGKPELSQIRHMGPMLRALADHMTAGRAKYPDQPDGTPNWKLGGKPDSEYLDAADRHLTAMIEKGEWFDPETGTPHAAAVVWNMGALITCNHPDEVRPGPRSTKDSTDLRHFNEKTIHRAVVRNSRYRLRYEHKVVMAEQAGPGDLWWILWDDGYSECVTGVGSAVPLSTNPPAPSVSFSEEEIRLRQAAGWKLDAPTDPKTGLELHYYRDQHG